MAVRKFRRRNNKKTKRTKRPRAFPTGRGAVTIVRKALSQNVTCSSAGALTIKDPTGATGASLFMGTPVISFNTSFANVYDVPFVMTFQLSDVLSYGDLTNLCDRYKILGVKVIIHGYNVAQVNGGLAYAPNPYIEFTTDYDDASIPTITQFDERMGTRTKGFSQQGMLQFKLKPRPTLYGTSADTVVVDRAMWIDCNDPTVPHYGIKGVFRNMSLYDTKSCGYKIQAFYTLAGKDFQ